MTKPMNNIKQLIILTTITTLFYCLLFVVRTAFPTIENYFYDYKFKFIKSTTPNEIVIVGIDSKAIKEIGEFPWPREVFAQLIKQINDADPAVIALNFVFPPRVDDPGSDSLRKTLESINQCVMGMHFEKVTDHAAPTALVAPLAYEYRFKEKKNSETIFKNFSYAAKKVEFGDPLIAKHATHAGFLNVSIHESNRTVRELVHVLRAGNEFYPSFALAAAASFLNMKKEDLVLNGNGSVHLSSKKIPLIRNQGSLRLNFRGEPGTITTLSAADILSNSITQEQLQNKLVFVGITTPSALPTGFFTTPVAKTFPGVELWATATLDIISTTYIKKGVIISIINWLTTLLLFPGCLFVFRKWRQLSTLLFCLSITTISIILELSLFMLFRYYWNSTYHVYALLILCLWSFGQKYLTTSTTTS